MRSHLPSIMVSVTLIICAVLAVASHVSSEALPSLVSHVRKHVQQMHMEALATRRATKVNGFKFNNCGKKGDVAEIRNLTISPAFLKAPGNVYVSFDVRANQTLIQPISLSVTAAVKIEGKWVKYPCTPIHIGSCDYEDICGYLSPIKQCPAPLIDNNIPCKCPFKQGHYTLPTSKFYLPTGLPVGDYYIKAEFGWNSKPAGCGEIYFSFR